MYFLKIIKLCGINKKIEKSRNRANKTEMFKKA